MNQPLHQAFGHDLVAQRRAEFELAARHGSLLRQLKELKRQARSKEPAVPRTRTSAASTGSGQVARACCAGDLG